MTKTDWEQDRRACETIIVDFLNDIDHKRFREAADLFSETGVWERLNDVLTGPQEIFDVIAVRPAGQRERHVVTNIQAGTVRDGAVSVLAYVMTFRAQDAAGTAAPIIGGPTSLADFNFQFSREKNCWKIAHLSSRLIFTFST